MGDGLRCRGASQALVELGLVLPVVLIMLLGMVDLGRAFVFGIAVQQGAREAARVASMAALDGSVLDATVLSRLISASGPAIMDCATILSTPQPCGGGTWTFTMSINGPASGSTYSSLSAARSAQTDLSGYRVEVRATGSVAMFAGTFTGLLGLSQISVQGDAVMVIT